jgi:hypothetical protein
MMDSESEMMDNVRIIEPEIRFLKIPRMESVARMIINEGPTHLGDERRNRGRAGLRMKREM